MPALDIRTVDSYDDFARDWHASTTSDTEMSLEDARARGLLNEQGTRQLWHLLGQLDADELVIKIPEWLAEEKVAATKRSTPVVFVGHVARETEKAVLFEDSVAARPLMSLAHRIHALEDGLSNTAEDDDRRPWLESRLRERREAFANRDGLISLRDEWLPKSQIQLAIQRETRAGIHS
jgi:hypothetical protein